MRRRGSAHLCRSALLLLALAALARAQGSGSPEPVPSLPGGTAAGSPPPGAAGPPLGLPSDATALPEEGAQPPAPAAFSPTPAGGTQLPPAPPSGFGLAPGIGAPAGKLAGEQRLAYQGTATVAYSQTPISPYQAVSLGCGLGYISPTFQSDYVGVSPDIFHDAAACGRCLRIQCDDASCANPGKQMPALVVDLCGSCTGLDMSVSFPLFVNLTGRDPGPNPSIVMSWDLIPCGNLTVGTIKMLLKKGGQAFYQAFGFSNSAVPIVGVAVNGTRLQHGSDNYWQWNPGSPIDPLAPLDIALAGSSRQVLRVRLPSLRSADLGVQFKS
ncbi:hypothetical protein ABPG75_000783 [Micractinium tetrahymenae]